MKKDNFRGQGLRSGWSRAPVWYNTYLQHHVVGNYDDQGSPLGELELFSTQRVGVIARDTPMEQVGPCKKLSQHIQV